MSFRPKKSFNNFNEFLAIILLVTGIVFFGVEGIYLFLAFGAFIAVLVWIKLRLSKNDQYDIHPDEDEEDKKLK